MEYIEYKTHIKWNIVLTCRIFKNAGKTLDEKNMATNIFLKTHFAVLYMTF